MIATKANVLKWAEAATDEQVIAGLDWYDDVREFVYRLSAEYHIPAADVAGAFAALSPRITVDMNYRATTAIVKSVCRGETPAGTTIPGVFSNVLKAGLIIYSGWASVSWDKAPKTWAFFQNIVDPHSADITIDIWAERVAYDNPKFQTTGGPNGASYARVADVYLQAALELNIQPCKLQAITWIAMREGPQMELAFGG